MVDKHSVVGLFLLLIFVIQGSKLDLKRKREYIKSEPENRQDLVDFIGRFIIHNIQRTEHSLTNPTLFLSPVAAGIIYRQLTTNTVHEQFKIGWYKKSVRIHTPGYLRRLPLADITHLLQGAITEVADDDWSFITNTPPQYTYDPTTRHLTLPLNPAITRLKVDFFPDFTPRAHHVRWSVLDPVPNHCLKSVSVTYFNPLTTDLSALPRVKTLQLYPTTPTVIILPQQVEFVETLGELMDNNPPSELAMTAQQQIIHEILICAVDITACNLNPSVKGPHTIRLDQVRIQHRTAITWPVRDVMQLQFLGGSWPRAGLDLSGIPFVASLEFWNFADHSAVALKNFHFPAEVDVMVFGPGAYPLLKYLDPAKFSGRVWKITIDAGRGYSEQFRFKHDCIPNLCRALLGADSPQITINHCTAHITALIRKDNWRIMSYVKWTKINVAGLKDYLANVNYYYDQ